MKANEKVKKPISKSKRLVPAGSKSDLLSSKQIRPMPTTKPYSDKTKIHSPLSRGF